MVDEIGYVRTRKADLEDVVNNVFFSHKKNKQ